MTLLARLTTPIKIGNIEMNDYRILHLSHSDNKTLNKINKAQLMYCPNLRSFVGQSLHKTWCNLLSTDERVKFKYGYWNKYLHRIKNLKLQSYLKNRY